MLKINISVEIYDKLIDGKINGAVIAISHKWIRFKKL